MSAVLQNPQAGFRPMVEADLPQILAIERRAYDFPWTRGIFRDCLRAGYSCWLYVRGGVIQAYCISNVFADEGHVLNITVRPESQGNGLGRKMLHYVVGVARRRGANTMLLEVRPSNRVALRLYHSMGFNELGVREDYYPAENGREDALILAKYLV